MAVVSTATEPSWQPAASLSRGPCLQKVHAYLGTCILAVHLNTQCDTSSSFPDMQHIQSALEVRLKDTSSATLQAVLRFCYTAECHLTPDNVLPICALAEHFEVKALHSACVQFIEHNISVSSCCTMLEMAAQYNMEALRKVTHYPHAPLAEGLTVHMPQLSLFPRRP
jgi:hypothetical protein